MKNITNRLVYLAGMPDAPQENVSEGKEKTSGQRQANETMARFMNPGKEFEAAANVLEERKGDPIEEGSKHYQAVNDLLPSIHNKSNEITDSLVIPGIGSGWVKARLEEAKSLDLNNLGIVRWTMTDTKSKEVVGYLAICREKKSDNYRVFYRVDRPYI